MVGAPGVGKSTVLDALASQWDATAAWALDPQHPAGGPWGKVGGLVPRGAYERAHPEFAALLFRALARANLEHPDERAARMGERAAALRRVFAKLEHAAERLGSVSVLVLDEGFLKHASALLDERYSGEPLARTLRRPQMPVGYVFADCAAEQAAGRIAGRGKQARSHLGFDPDEVMRLTRRSVDYWRRVADRVEAARLPVLRLDTASSPERNAHRIAGFADEVGAAGQAHPGLRSQA